MRRNPFYHLSDVRNSCFVAINIDKMNMKSLVDRQCDPN